MDIREPIHTKDDYQAALKEVSRSVDLDPARGSEDADKLEILAALVTAYETTYYPATPPVPD